MAGIAAVVLTKNEEFHIVDCLESLSWANELIVLDSFSTDQTAQLAVQAGASVHQNTFRDYADQRNTALTLVREAWVLFVDADERVSDSLAQEIRTSVAQSSTVGWWIPRHNYIFGHRMRGTGWYPDHQLRLFQPDKGQYDPNRHVHELVNLQGPAGYLTQPLIHYNYDSLRDFLTRQNRYSEYDAQILHNNGQRTRPRNFILQPLREFNRRFMQEAGYRDHIYGLWLSLLMAYFEFVKYRKLHALRNTGKVK